MFSAARSWIAGPQSWRLSPVTSGGVCLSVEPPKGTKGRSRCSASAEAVTETDKASFPVLTALGMTDVEFWRIIPPLH